MFQKYTNFEIRFMLKFKNAKLALVEKKYVNQLPLVVRPYKLAPDYRYDPSPKNKIILTDLDFIN